MDSNIQIKEFVSESTKIKSIITADDRNFDLVGHIEELTVTKNGTYTKDGVAYSPVIVNVPVDASELSVTENGEYTPQTGKYYSKVTVNVPTSTVTPPDWYTDGGNSVIPESSEIHIADLSTPRGSQTTAVAGDGKYTPNSWAEDNNISNISSWLWLWNSNGVMILGYTYS